MYILLDVLTVHSTRVEHMTWINVFWLTTMGPEQNILEAELLFCCVIQSLSKPRKKRSLVRWKSKSSSAQRRKSFWSVRARK